MLIFKQMFTTKQQGLTLYQMYIQHKGKGLESMVKHYLTKGTFINLLYGLSLYKVTGTGIGHI